LARDPAGGWLLTSGGATPETLHCDVVILAPKVAAAARLMETVHPQLAEHLAAIPHASCSVVALGYRRDQIAHAMDGFGFVVPRVENRRILSGSFSSVKYPGRAPDGAALVRAFIGGELQPELAALPDDELIAIAREELGQLLGISGEPNLTLISRYDRGMPQYYVGHGERVRQIESGLQDLPGLYFTGNAFGGVGIPYCIFKSEKIAEQAAAHLRAVS
jgi:oxygen-dependent protoporphyrinogen oxidase